MTTRAALAAFAAFHASQNPTAEARIALSDADALELVAEAGVAEQLEHAETVAVGASALHDLPPAPGADNPDGLAEWAKLKTEASQKLWDGLAGAVIDGVTVIRKRPL